MSYSVGGYPYDEGNMSVITDVMFPQFPEDTTTDVGVVLGAGIASLPLLRKAAELLIPTTDQTEPKTKWGARLRGHDGGLISSYRSGTRIRRRQVEHLILCGGAVVNELPETAKYRPLFAPLYTEDEMPKGNVTEAEWMAGCLKAWGIPEESFTIENASKNTGETFANLQGIAAFRDAESVNIIGLLPTRALMTMRKVEKDLGAVKKVAVLTNVIPLPGVTREDWERNTIAETFVMTEFLKIDPTSEENYFLAGYCIDINLEEEIGDAKKLLRKPAKGMTFDSNNNQPSV